MLWRKYTSHLSKKHIFSIVASDFDTGATDAQFYNTFGWIGKMVFHKQLFVIFLCLARYIKL